MAITPVQMPSQRPRAQSTIEQIATGVDAAAKILGLGINAYKVFGIDKPNSDSEVAKNSAATNYYNAEAATKNNPYYMQANPEDIRSHKSHQIPGPDGSLIDVVPRQQEQYDNAGLRITTGADDKQEKDAENLIKHLDVNRASSRTALGRAVTNFGASQKLGALLKPVDGHEDQLSPQQVYELARTADTILSQSGATLGGTEHLLPKSAVGDFASFRNYITNQPGGAGMGEWVRNLKHMSDREGALAKNQFDSELDATAKASAYGRLAKTSPERYKAIIDAYRNSVYSAPQEASAHPAATASDIEAGKNFIQANPNDPRVPDIKQRLGIQ